MVKITCGYCAVLTDPKVIASEECERGRAFFGLCTNCQGPIVWIVDSRGHYFYHPKPTVKLLKCPKHLPKKIENSYIEATICFAYETYRATAMMSRRTVQLTVRDLGAKGSNLEKEIEDLEKKGLITPFQKEIAHEIRFFGNEAAHPHSDEFEIVDKEEAEGILKFTQELLHHLYEAKKELEELRKKRKK